MPANKSSVMHMGIDEPNTKRKLVLGSALGCVQALQNYEKYLVLKKEKLKLKNKFTKLVRSVNREFKEFYELMPEVHIHEPKKEIPKPIEVKKAPKKEVKKKPAKIKVPKPPKKKLSPEMSKLEHDMENLKHKLNSL